MAQLAKVNLVGQGAHHHVFRWAQEKYHRYFRRQGRLEWSVAVLGEGCEAELEVVVVLQPETPTSEGERRVIGARQVGSAFSGSFAPTDLAQGSPLEVAQVEFLLFNPSNVFSAQKEVHLIMVFDRMWLPSAVPELADVTALQAVASERERSSPPGPEGTAPQSPLAQLAAPAAKAEGALRVSDRLSALLAGLDVISATEAWTTEEVELLQAAHDLRAKCHSFAQRCQSGQEAPPVHKQAQALSWRQLGRVAESLRGMYSAEHAFPQWSVEMLKAGQLLEHARSAVVYYCNTDNRSAVERVAKEREPVGPGVENGRSSYNESRLRSLFGFSKGAYREGSASSLMPNIAQFCCTPLATPEGELVEANIINVACCLLDEPGQVDAAYFLPLEARPRKWQELVGRMQQTWRLIFECALRHRLRYVVLPSEDDAEFVRGLANDDSDYGYAALMTQSLSPVMREFGEAVEVVDGVRLPEWIFSPPEVPRIRSMCLLVNICSPWTLVGAGEAAGDSLDGCFGVCSALTVLCWPQTNPFLQWEGVDPVL